MGAQSEVTDSVLETIGDTPLVPLRRVTTGLPESVEVWAKLEFANPGGSVKDRPARQIILDALDAGDLDEQTVLIDSTSGNTGIAYAMVGAALGVDVELVMPENVSSARKFLIQRYGAKCTYSDPLEGSDGAQRLTEQMVADDTEGQYFYANQYANESNPRAHYLTTGPEIWDQTDGEVTHFVAATGTSGTLMGTGRYLREQSRSIELVGAQPASSFHGLEGLKHMETAIEPDIYSPDILDDIEYVETEAGWDMAKRVARREGIGAGYSAGANIVAALRVAERLERGVVVTVVCDHIERYIDEAHGSQNFNDAEDIER